MVGFEQEVTEDQIRDIANQAIGYGSRFTVEIMQFDAMCKHVKRELMIPDDTVKELFWKNRQDEWNLVDTVIEYINLELNYC